MNIRMRHLLSVSLAFFWFALLFSPSPGEVSGEASLASSAGTPVHVEALLADGASSGLGAGHDATVPGKAAEYPFFIKPPALESAAADRSADDLEATGAPSSPATALAALRKSGAPSLLHGSPDRRALLCVYRL